MDISEFAFKIILIFIPGIISFLIIENLTEYKKIDNFRIALYSLLLGFLNYLVFYIILWILNIISRVSTKISVFSFVEDTKMVIDLKEILFVTLISIPLGFIVAFAVNKTWLHKFALKIRISRKIGESDVFKHMINIIKPDPGWVTIRDLKNDLMYIGWIYAYSSLKNDIELFLRNVTIYKNSSGKEILDTPGLYIHKLNEDSIIEFNDIAD